MEQKTVVITGSSGDIGSAAAVVFASHGWNVAIHGFHNKKRLLSLKSRLKQMGCQCHSFCGDLSDPVFTKDMISSVIDTFGSVDCLVNNAGISMTGLFTDTTIQQWQNIFNANLFSAMNACHSVLPHMIHKKSGKIIQISSVWGHAGASCEVLYSSSKGALNAFTRALAKEVAPSGIQVNAIAFGMIDTQMNAGYSLSDKTHICEEIPAGHMATAKEAAQMIYHICTAPSYLTGDIITCSGGWYIR